MLLNIKLEAFYLFQLGETKHLTSVMLETSFQLKMTHQKAPVLPCQVSS